MATEWHSLRADKLTDFFHTIEKKFPGKSISIVEAEALAPQRGAFVMIQSREDAEALYLPDVLILHSKRVVAGYEVLLDEKFKHACFISAESKTADIEKKLISGVHGPGECFFVQVK